MKLVDTSSGIEYLRDADSAGVTVPVADIVMAAASVRHGLELEHCDRHLERILPVAANL